MRLCMLLMYVEKSGLNYLNDANIQFLKNLTVNVETISAWLNEIVQQMVTQSNQNKSGTVKMDGNKSENVDLLKVKRSSMDIFCRLIAITNQYQSIDRSIQTIDLNFKLDKDGMLDVLNEMNQTKEALTACQDDFQCLQLIYNKYLVQKFELPPIEIIKNDGDNQTVNVAIDSERIDANVKMNVEEESKEYFAMRDVNNDRNTDSDSDGSADEKPSRGDWQNELDNIDMKVTRSYFAPVLKQLKTKIDPIKTEMKERELKFLMSKGIDREQIMEFDKNEENPVRNGSSDSDTGSDSDSSDVYKRKRKTKSRPDRYNEMRSFLEQKQPIRFMPLNLPLPSATEDVLE